MRDAMHSLQSLADERQHDRILRLSFPNEDGPTATLLVNTLQAFEGLSRPFDYTLELLSDDALIALKDLQGKMLCVELVRKDGTLRYFTGRVLRFSLKKVDGGFAFYEARLGPWLNYLGLRKDNYLFHDATLYEQTQSVFGDYGTLAEWEWRVRGAQPPMISACQFDESDANYLARRWAAAGLVYWFEHRLDGHTGHQRRYHHRRADRCRLRSALAAPRRCGGRGRFRRLVARALAGAGQRGPGQLRLQERAACRERAADLEPAGRCPQHRILRIPGRLRLQG